MRSGKPPRGARSELSQKQTSSREDSMSALASTADIHQSDGYVPLCATSGLMPCTNFVSLDHLVGAAKQHWRDLDAQLFCRL